MIMQTSKIKSLFYLMALALFAACTDNAFNLSSDESANVENEASTDSYYDDVDDMSVVVVASDDATLNGGKSGNGGRKIAVTDNRFSCEGIVIEITPDPASTSDHPRGTITINFGTGCTDPRGNVRSGIIVISYDGRRFLPGAVITTTFENYTINGIQLEGIRTVTNISGSVEDKPRFHIELTGGKATWPDATSATREVNLTREWTRTNNPLQDSWSVTGTAAGSNRASRVYSMEITDPLVYKRECALSKIFIPVSGTKVLTAGDKQITIDYGDGVCDRKVTVTVNGKSKETLINGD
jgi:hypothetical protein